MKKVFITITALIAIASIANPIQGRSISISRNKPYTFSLVSFIKRRPVSVHKQNEDYLRISCKVVNSFKKDQFIHSCTIRPKSGAPEGTFALFKKTPNGSAKPLFHVSVEF